MIGEENMASSTLVWITCWSLSEVVQIGLPSKLLLASGTKTGAVRRTTFGPFRKRRNSDPDYFQAALFRPRLQWYGSRFGPNQEVIRTSVKEAYG